MRVIPVPDDEQIIDEDTYVYDPTAANARVAGAVRAWWVMGGRGARAVVVHKGHRGS